MVECFKVWLYWQGIVHDLSKFGFTEFVISAKYYQWKSSPIDKERIEQGYSLVRLHHKARNKHHFHYWIDIDRWQITPVRMPYKYILEMCCDFIWAWKAYNNVWKDLWEPLKYREEKINKDFIHHSVVEKVNELLNNYKNTGNLLHK